MFTDPNSPQGRYIEASRPYLWSLNLQAYLEEIWERYYFGELTKPQFVEMVKAKQLFLAIDRLNLGKLSQENAVETLKAFLAFNGIS